MKHQQSGSLAKLTLPGVAGTLPRHRHLDARSASLQPNHDRPTVVIPPPARLRGHPPEAARGAAAGHAPPTTRARRRATTAMRLSLRRRPPGAVRPGTRGNSNPIGLAYCAGMKVRTALAARRRHGKARERVASPGLTRPGASICGPKHPRARRDPFKPAGTGLFRGHRGSTPAPILAHTPRGRLSRPQSACSLALLLRIRQANPKHLNAACRTPSLGSSTIGPRFAAATLGKWSTHLCPQAHGTQPAPQATGADHGRP